ncbi:MAG: hypothetical protein H7318_07310 [Oligoflexus sp.]|nr:hypothetical protein [Oligoflexus sp.]
MMLGTISKSLVIGSLLSLTVACSQQEAPKSQKVQTKISHLRDQVANAPVRNRANAALSCEQIWTGFLAANPLGYSKEYKSITVTEYAGGEGLPAPETVTETQKDTVSASSDAGVSITHESTSSAAPAPIPAETQELTKVDFLTQCNAAPTNAAATSPVAEPTVAETTGADGSKITTITEAGGTVTVQTDYVTGLSKTVTTKPDGTSQTTDVTAQGSEKLAVTAGSFDTDFVKGNISATGENAFEATVGEWYLTGTDFLAKSEFKQVSKFDSITVTTKQTVELISLLNPPAGLIVPAAPATAGL